MLIGISFVLFLVCLVYFIYAVKGGVSAERDVFTSPSKNSVYISLILTLIFFCLFMSPFKIVPADSRGIRFTLGALDSIELQPGLRFKIPVIQSIKNISIRPMEITFTIPVGPEGSITKDNQTIGATVTLFYIYKQGEFVQMYKDYGEEKIKSILLASITELFKAQVGQYDIFSLPLSQDTIAIDTFNRIAVNMSDVPIKIIKLNITNYDWSDEFDKQIASTMEAAQKVKQKGQELLIEEQEAQKRVKQAQADRTANVERATGEKEAAALRADAKMLEGEGIRKYNESIRQNMEMELEFRRLKIEEIRANSWDGRLVPTNNYGPIPIETGRLQPESSVAETPAKKK